MKKMLVLLKCPEDVEGHLVELREISRRHGIAKVFLTRVASIYGSMDRRGMAARKLDMPARMSDADAERRFSNIVDRLRTEDVDVEPISASIQLNEIDNFIRENRIDVIVTGNGLSGLCCWFGTDLSGRRLLFLFDYIFEPMRHGHQEQTREAIVVREQKHRANGKHRRDEIK